MKPDWKDAPEWANWLAMDQNGDWTWFEKEPLLSGTSNIWTNENGTTFLHASSSEAWKETKEAKPQ